ncbi:MAG: cold-shock protein [Planctomycetota bacterium]|jgi:cold shock CspA family protein
MNIQQGTIKFVNNKGYGFAKSDGKDVYLHVTGFRVPFIKQAVYPQVPTLEYEQGLFKIDPNDFNKDDEITMEVEEGPKGPMAKRWWYTVAETVLKQKIADLRVYKLIARYVQQGEPYGNQEKRCWMIDRSLREVDVFTGYLAQMRHYNPATDAQIQAYVREEGTRWVPCDCPIGRYNGGPMFNMPPTWTESVRIR